MKYTKIINYVVYGTLGTLFFFISSAILFYKQEEISKKTSNQFISVSIEIQSPRVVSANGGGGGEATQGGGGAHGGQGSSSSGGGSSGGGGAHGGQGSSSSGGGSSGGGGAHGGQGSSSSGGGSSGEGDGQDDRKGSSSSGGGSSGEGDGQDDRKGSSKSSPPDNRGWSEPPGGKVNSNIHDKVPGSEKKERREVGDQIWEKTTVEVTPKGGRGFGGGPNRKIESDRCVENCGDGKDENRYGNSDSKSSTTRTGSNGVVYNNNGEPTYIEPQPIYENVCTTHTRIMGPYYSAARAHNDGRLVPTGYIRNISSYGIKSAKKYDKCVDVTNNAGNTIYIPTKTSAEFNSFLNNPPPKVSVKACRHKTEDYEICVRQRVSDDSRPSPQAKQKSGGFYNVFSNAVRSIGRAISRTFGGGGRASSSNTQSSNSRRVSDGWGDKSSSGGGGRASSSNTQSSNSRSRDDIDPRGQDQRDSSNSRSSSGGGGERS